MPNPGMRAMVAPVPTEPSPRGLLGPCVTQVTATDMHELNGTESVSGACIPSSAWQDCPAGTWTNPAEKVFTRPEIVASDPITAYAGIECSTFGITQAEAEAMALDALRRGEQRVVEDFFLRQVLCPLAVDVTPAAGAVSPLLGVALLEEWLDAETGGPGLIHAGVAAGVLLGASDALCGCAEDCPSSLAGSSLVVGGGYGRGLSGDDCDTAPAAGEAWIYVTPPVRVRRDARHLVPSGQVGSVNTRTNDRRVLAESTFVAEIACPLVGAIRVTIA